MPMSGDFGFPSRCVGVAVSYKSNERGVLKWAAGVREEWVSKRHGREEEERGLLSREGVLRDSAIDKRDSMTRAVSVQDRCVPITKPTPAYLEMIHSFTLASETETHKGGNPSADS
jgi:hypothetical protein